MIERETRDSVTILKMQRHPANVLDVDFSDAVEGALAEANDDSGTTAIVVTGSGGIFSAGVDLFRLLEGGDDYLTAFLRSLDRLFGTAVSSPTPLVAAINGHAIAGGGILALACDFRVMTEGPAMIGLPELKVGVPFPRSALSIVRAVVPPQHLRQVLLLGRNFDPVAARDRGLVDEVVPEGEVLDRAVAIATELGRVPARTFRVTKQLLATPPRSGAGTLDDEVHATWADPVTHEHIRDYLEATLGKRSR